MKEIKHLVVGRSEGVVYPQNNLNLTYNQFKPIKPILNHPETHFIDLMVREIKEAKNDDDIKKILYKIYVTTQIDSMIRAEFDNYRDNK